MINILETIFAVLRYAKKCGTRTTLVSFSDLTIRESESLERPFFTVDQRPGNPLPYFQCLLTWKECCAKEPYKTIFALTSIMVQERES